jgi:hypothetical protein
MQVNQQGSKNKSSVNFYSKVAKIIVVLIITAR